MGMHSPLAVLSRRGRVGGAILLVLGMLMILGGLWLTGLLGSSGVWAAPRMAGGLSGGVLAFVVVGLALSLLGANSLFGPQARVASAIGVVNEVKSQADPRAVAQAIAVPFWICSDCKVVESGLSACCLRCGNTVGFVQVGHEHERGIAGVVAAADAGMTSRTYAANGDHGVGELPAEATAKTRRDPGA